MIRSRIYTPGTLGASTSVASLAALKALKARPRAVAVATGQAKGEWDWFAGDTTTPDDGTVVQCTSGAAGRYKRRYNGSIESTFFADVLDATDAALAVGDGYVQIPAVPAFNITFAAPDFGATWDFQKSVIAAEDVGATSLTNHDFYSGTHNWMPGPHSGTAKSANWMGGRVKGSGANGPGSADHILTIYAEKDDWANGAQGEIDGINIFLRQGVALAGGRSDSGGILVNTGQLDDTGFQIGAEMTQSVFNRSDFSIAKQMNLQLFAINSLVDGDIGTKYAHGLVLTAAVGALDTALLVQDTSTTGTWTSVIESLKSGGTVKLQHQSSGNRWVFDSTGNRFTGNVAIGTTISTNGQLTVAAGGNEGVEFLCGVAAAVSRLLFYDRAGGAYNTARFDALGHDFYVSGTSKATLSGTALNLASGVAFSIAGTQVLGPRVTGFVTAAGTANKDASGINVDTITATDANIQALAKVVKALMDKDFTHGFIGA